MQILKIKTPTLGIIFLCSYIFFSYTAQGIVIPRILNTVSLYLFVLWGIVKIIVRKKVQIGGYTKWYTCFLIFSIFIMIYSPKFDLFSNSEMHLMFVTIVLTYLVYVAVQTEGDLKKLFWCYSIASFVLITILYFTGNLVASQSNRLGGDIVGNANTFAGMIMVAVMYEMWLLVYETDRKKILKIILIAMLLLNTYAMLLSGGRKFIIIPIIFFYILLIMKKNSSGRRSIIKYTVIIILIIAVLYSLMMNIPMLYDVVGYRMQFLVNSITGRGEIGESASIRSLMKTMAIKRWISSPLWGYGFDSFKYYNQTVTGHQMYSHCNYTELLYNGGLLYFFLYYSFYIYQLKYIWKYRKIVDTKNLAFSLAVLISLFIFDYGAVAYSLTNVQIMLCLVCKILQISVKKCDIEEANI